MGAQYEGDFFTPSTVLAEMKQVDAAIASLAKDMAASALSEATKEEFKEFASEWQTFYDDNKGVLSRILNTTYATTLEFRDRYDAWRRRFIVEGGQTSSPELGNKPFGSSLSVATLAIIGVSVAGLGWLAYRFFRE